MELNEAFAAQVIAVDREGRYGLATLCVSGGLGGAMLFERFQAGWPPACPVASRA